MERAGALITGGTGLIGRELLKRLSAPVVTCRNPYRVPLEPGSARVVRWEPEVEAAPEEALRGVNAVFNLAGEPVAGGRWTRERKRRIRDSRVVGTRNLVAGMAGLRERPAVLVSASAVGYYGDRGDEELDERSRPGSDFLSQVCQAWEQEALAAEKLGVRVVCVRIGIVLAAEGGTLARMLAPFKMGVGGRLGDGKQWMSWVHLHDVAGILLHAARTEAIRGAMNAVSPRPVTNADFTRALGQALHRPTLLPVPRLALRLAFGEMGEILTGSQRAFPRVAEGGGYGFKYPELGEALQVALAAPSGPGRQVA